MPLIELRDVRRVYDLGEVEVHALRSVTLNIERGEYVALTGPSGSGKSTLMNTLGCLDRPTHGSYLLDGEEIVTMSRDQRARIRNRQLGFVFQNFNLLNRTSALENVELPLVYRRVPKAERHVRARRALDIVGLAGRESHTPAELSGGQQQRVAIARALVTEPSLLLADEPTGNLDSARSEEIMRLLVQLNQEQGLTIVMVTHEPDLAEFGTRVVVFRDGRVIDDRPTRRPA